MLIDAADQSTPSAIRTELVRFAGLNPYNRANWRLVLAQERLCRRGGVFQTMPSGDVKTIELEPVTHNGRKAYIQHVKEIKPESVVTGTRDVPKYPVKGWILERWFPASTFGGRSAWEAVKSSDGVTPMMGPYPHEGDYFMLAGPFTRIPEMQDLREAIAMHIRLENEQPQSYQQLMLQQVNEEQEEMEKAYQKCLSDLAHFYESEVEPILKGTSLGAQRIRNDMAETMGDRSHQGVA